MIIRPETNEDRAAIHDVNVEAFEGPAEADLVDVLRDRATPFISLVAVEQDEVVGHICFTPVALENDPACRALGLAPMAVRPDWQKRGLGTQLVRRGLEECKRLGHDFVVVVGHSHYYPRFGFGQASAKGLRCEFPVPDDVFMVLELRPGSLEGRQGLVRYHPAFSEC
jgi:putative acetyltransferase